MLSSLRQAGVRVAGLLLSIACTSACTSIIPPQPETAPPPTSRAASGSPSTAAGSPRTATVTGTGRFGLSIRKSPGLASDRIATVPDGFQAAVVGGPVGQDGSDWYQLQAPDVTGWASAAYLTISAAGSAPAPSSNGGARASGSPDSSLSTPLSQATREKNYDVGGSGIYVQTAVRAAVDHLHDSSTATDLLSRAAPAYVRITVDHFQAVSEGGEFSTIGHSIKMADSMLRESLDVQSAVLAHELQHAVDILVDHAVPDKPEDCVNLELRAYKTQEKVWLELTKPSPPRTNMEAELDQISHTVNTPDFARNLAQQYASECSVYGSR